MCIFSRPVTYVGQTRILVSVLPDGWHATICGLEVQASQPTAVYFPVPLQGRDDGQTLLFVDLSDYPGIFADIDHCFSDSSNSDFVSHAAPLTVTADPQPYQSWFLRSVDEIKMLPEQARMDRRVLNAMPAYWDCGFAVFMIDPAPERRVLMPMAYGYLPLKPEEMFFPTVQVQHGEQIQPVTDYDHVLYYQQSPHFGHVREWQDGTTRPCNAMDLEKLHGLMHPDNPVQRLSLFGNLPNCDQVLRCSRLVEPEFRSPFDLERGAGQARQKLWDLLPDDINEPASQG